MTGLRTASALTPCPTAYHGSGSGSGSGTDRRPPKPPLVRTGEPRMADPEVLCGER
ncbi:hypothetical protein SAMD00023353_3100420 [Rosellinia necatrix]|uniref:Uncharacterized protein n=1 Tax=Rosellinia necatrix TaxID=77044 RepID=A0A1S8A8J5_ROSNE|nr:hypothetical protein SAMD00023353_3100420 [Rosellinia necatrix]